MRRKLLNTFGVALAGVVIAGTVGLTSGALALVTTHGNSMAPRMAVGDLVMVRSSTYKVGDVVAYHSRELKQVVLHRVIGRDGPHYLFQGDNNDFVDPETPTADDLIGEELLRIPGGGIWLDRLTSPTALGLIAFALLAAGGGAVQTRRRRRLRKRGTMARHAARTSRSPVVLSTLSPRLRAIAAGTAAVGALGLALGALTWTGPFLTLAPSAQQDPPSMTFAYSAAVPQTPAYDSTTVSSPDPVFRRLSNTVDVSFRYQGRPGSVTVNAALTTANGWRSTVPLAARQTFTTSRYQGTVRLDLTALERRAHAAAAVTGLPADQVTVTVAPQVTTTDGRSFAPTLGLALTPLQLKLAGDPTTLTTQDVTAVQQSAQASRTLSLVGQHVSVATGRLISTLMLLAALLAAGALLLLAHRSAPASEGDAIRRRYAALLLPVHPMSTPAGRPIIDVTEFANLVKLVEQYGALILHWTRSGVETFVVQDEGTTYRYRTGVDNHTNSMTLTDTTI